MISGAQRSTTPITFITRVMASSERVVTSSVIKGPGQWWDETYLVPHEPVRWDLDEANRLLQEEHFDGTVQWKVGKTLHPPTSRPFASGPPSSCFLHSSRTNNNFIFSSFCFR